MMCLIVRTSIHPTSASTGTEDDMGGNDKADALAELFGIARTDGGVGRNLFSKSGSTRPVLPFYDISRTRMHLGGLKKSGLWPCCDMAPVSLAVGGDLQSALRRISLTNRKIIVFL